MIWRAKMIQIHLCKTYKDACNKASLLLEKNDIDNRIVAIETEYGDQYFGCKNGATLELLHHGNNSNNKPASTALIPDNNNQHTDFNYNVFFISHIDLDTVFGIMWAGGYLKNTKPVREISELVGFLDTNGFYKFKNEVLDYNNENHIILLAITSLINFWSIELNSISKDIHKLILRIRDYIMDGVPEDIKKYLIKSSDNESEFLENITNYQLSIPKVLVTYISHTSVSDRYLNNGMEYDIILQYNIGSNSITLASKDDKTAERYFGKSGVIEPLQLFFGKEAGGHKTIAGSPRNFKLQIEYLEAFLKFLKRNYFNI
jgi:hypothetical protein